MINLLSPILSSTIHQSEQHQEKNSWECWELNPGLLGEKSVCYLCAMQLPTELNSSVALKPATISLDQGLTQGWLTIIFSGVPSSGNALAIPSPFCPPEPQPLPPTSPAAFSPSQSPPLPPITTTRLVQSGFLMHSELSKNKPAKPSRRARSAAAKRYFVLYLYSGFRVLVNRKEPWIDWSWVRF